MKRYKNGTCYIGVVGPSTIPVDCMISIMNMRRQDGDTVPSFIQATKGYEGRQAHFNRMIESSHDWLLLLDHDMIYEEDTLTRLRSHGYPYVTGYYMRRRANPIASVWYEPFDGQFPLMPYTDLPPTDKLIPLGGSGWGCMLLHREVIEKTRSRVLNGEWDVIEDDMDVWPHTGEPLRNSYDPVGSDIRYPIYAQAAGYQLMGDANVAPRHMVHYGLSANDFKLVPETMRQQWAESIRDDILKKRGEVSS